MTGEKGKVEDLNSSLSWSASCQDRILHMGCKHYKLRPDADEAYRWERKIRYFYFSWKLQILIWHTFWNSITDKVSEGEVLPIQYACLAGFLWIKRKPLSYAGR